MDRDRRLALSARHHHGLFTRDEARAAGYSLSTIDRRLRSGLWVRAQPGVYRASVTPTSVEQVTLAACLGSGPEAVASHRSAAWLWGLVDRHPSVPDITVPQHHRPGPRRVTVYRSRAPIPFRVVQRGVPVTDPLRTLVDVARVVDGAQLDDAVDRALATRMADVGRLLRAAVGLSRTGRTGPAQLRASLTRRGLVDPPNPSVLESRTRRLLTRGRVQPLAAEVVWGSEGEYRIDFLLAPRVALEVDGYAWHFSAAHMTYDERRRTAIRLSGVFLIVATWMDVVHDGDRVLADVAAALRDHSS